MIRQSIKRPLITSWAVAFGVLAAPFAVTGQEAPGDQLFSFGFSQKIGTSDNIRLQNPSVGTTYYSDSTLSFGFVNENGPGRLTFDASGVGRIVDDPLAGTTSGFRDPRVDLTYTREGANARLSLIANYYKPDLAFLDPLERENIDDQDLFEGGGTREEFTGGVVLETGLQDPFGLIFDVNSRYRSYSGTSDPLLFDNQTDTAAVGAIFRFSDVFRGRLDASNDHYWAEDLNQTDRETRRFTFGIDYDISPATFLSVDVGHSKVLETFDALPGVENNLSGPVATVAFDRQMSNGSASALLDTYLTDQGRQTTLEFSRVLELPNGGLEFSFGAAKGDTFDARPIGSIAYFARLPRGSFNIGLSRTSSISDTLSQATETTRFDMGYALDLTPVSSLSFDLYYADIFLVGNNSSGAGRERGSFNASYAHNVTEDWDIVVGYEYRYYQPTSGNAANSNGVFFTLQRDLDVFR